MTDEPQEVRVHAPSGESSFSVGANERTKRLSELLHQNGLPLNVRCGEEGLCEGCRIELVKGTVLESDTGIPVTAETAPLSILACMHRLGPESVTLQVSTSSLAFYEPSVLTEFRVNIPYSQDPLWRSDATESIVLTGHPIGAAIDVGTTTVSLLLVDLDNGQVLACASTFNHQMYLGDDVVTRINLCLQDPGQVRRLQEALVQKTLRPLLEQAVLEAGIEPRQIVCLTAAGNTTMLHLLAGEDPSPMGAVPFEPVFLEHRRMPLSAVGMGEPFSSTATLHLLPSAAAYIGADLTAGVIVSGLLYEHGPSLLVDIGTNGEIILKHDDILIGCATAAGPAFEGAGLSHGCRAGSGAISHIHLSTDPFNIMLEVIDDAPPIGLCGSAYIDFLAQGVRLGLLSASGRFTTQHCPEAESRLHVTEGQGMLFEVAPGLGISEADIAKLLQAKAAIAAGILTLLDRAGVSADKVRRLYLAGGFGMNVQVDHAIGCGLLPGMRADQVELAGNSSLAGAYVALVDRHLIPQIAKASQQMQVIELNLDPDFEDRYIDELALKQ